MSTNVVPIYQSSQPNPRRYILWQQEGRKCHWCGCDTLYTDDQVWDQATIDHILPRYRGGGNAESNLVSACRLCNNRRSHEDAKGLPDGALLGNYHPRNPTVVSSKKSAARVVLSGDEKRAIRGKKGAEDVLREQRDQMLRDLTLTRKELKLFHKIVEDQELELKSMTVIKLIRKQLVEKLLTWVKK